MSKIKDALIEGKRIGGAVSNFEFEQANQSFIKNLERDIEAYLTSLEREVVTQESQKQRGCRPVKVAARSEADHNNDWAYDSWRDNHLSDL